jgi:hypothetical protein
MEEKHMVIEAIAVGAITILKQYLGKAGEAFAKKAGEKLANKVGELYQSIKGKFKSDPYAEKTLARAEEDPTSADRLSALEGVLREKLGDDPNFASLLDRLVQEVKAADTKRILVLGDRNIAVGRDASGTFITGDKNQVGKS